MMEANRTFRLVSPPGGCVAAAMELAPEGNDFHEFVRDGLAPWADPDDAGMHRTATLDYDLVLRMFPRLTDRLKRRLLEDILDPG
jgi:hypothetical protein